MQKIFTEVSYYHLQHKDSETHSLKIVGQTDPVIISNNYVVENLISADDFTEVVNVGKEDKYWTAKQVNDAGLDVSKVGTLKELGIKSILNNVGSIAFTVVYKKKDTVLSNKAYQQALADYAAKAPSKVDVDYLKGVPIQVIPGETRVLRGYLKSVDTNDGYYEVVDLDINETRKVNINTIEELIFRGTKYVVK